MSNYTNYSNTGGGNESFVQSMPPNINVPPPNMSSFTDAYSNSRNYQNSGTGYRENPAWRTNEDVPPPKRQKIQDGGSSSNPSGDVYVYGLGQHTTNDALRTYFSRWGQVLDAVVQVDPKTQRGTGYGYVRFGNPHLAGAARSADNHIIDGQRLILASTLNEVKQLSVSAEQGCKVFVGGLSATTTTESLARYFNNWGQVVGAQVIVDQETQRSKQFGHVIFAEKSSAEYVIHAGPHTIDGKVVNTNSTSIPPVATTTPPSAPVGDTAPEESRTIYLSGLHKDTAEDTISYYFSNFGRVLDTFLKRDPQTNQCQGYACIIFSNPKAAETALNAESHYISGQQVRVQKNDPTIGQESSRAIQAPSEPASEEARTLFVGGLNPESYHESVKAYFNNFGQVLKAYIKRDPETHKSMGYAFILFTEAYMVESVLRSGPHVIDGWRVFVNKKESSAGDSSDAGDADTPEPARTIFIGGLRLDTYHDTVKGYFARFGKILKTYLKRDPETQKFLGYAYILYSDSETVDRVLNAGPHVIDGRQVFIQRKDALTSTETGSEAPEDVRTLFVGGLNYDTTHDTVKSYFNKFGNVQKAFIKRDPQSKKSQGYGFVLFSEPYMLGNVFNAAPHTIDGNQVIINYKTASAKEEEVTEEERTIFVGNLSCDITHEILKSYFGLYGKVLKCYVKMDPETKSALGYAFVTFSEPFMVGNVMNTKEHWLCGQKISVNPKTAPPLDNNPPEVPEEARTIFVAGLDEDATHESVKGYFNKFGKVQKAFVKIDADTKKCHGFAFVMFSEPFMVDNVFIVKSHRLDGKQIFVNRKTSKDDVGKDSEIPEAARTVFVGGLNPDTSHDTVKSYFCRFGTVLKTFIKKDPETQKSQGYGFIAFSDPYMVEKVFKAAPHRIDGYEVFVNWRTSHQDKEPQSESDASEDKKTVYFAGVDPKTSHETVRNYFSYFGMVTRTFMKKDQDTGRSLGYGYVIFSETFMAEHVFNNNNHQIDGSRVYVNRKIPEGTEVSEDARTLFVGGLNFETNHTTLRKYFSRYGNVEKAFIKMDQDTKKSKGYAFVVFSEPHMICNVFTTVPHVIDKRQVFINWKTGKDGDSDERSSVSLPDISTSPSNQPFSSKSVFSVPPPFASGAPPFASGPPPQPFSGQQPPPFSGTGQPPPPFSGQQSFQSDFNQDSRFNSSFSNSSMNPSHPPFGRNDHLGGPPPPFASGGGATGRFSSPMQDPFTRWMPGSSQGNHSSDKIGGRSQETAAEKQERDVKFSFLATTHPLSCSFCKWVTTSESEYLDHVSSNGHKVEVQQRQQLLGKELARTFWNSMKQTESEVKKGASLKFCASCLLHYTESLAQHKSSESHMAMTVIINPECRSCFMTFQSLEGLERHCCTIPHIRTKYNKMIQDGTIPDVLTIPKESSLVLERTCYVSGHRGLYCASCNRFFLKSQTSALAHCESQDHIKKLKKFIMNKKQRLAEGGGNEKESDVEEDEQEEEEAEADDE